MNADGQEIGIDAQHRHCLSSASLPVFISVHSRSSAALMFPVFAPHLLRAFRELMFNFRLLLGSQDREQLFSSYGG